MTILEDLATRPKSPEWVEMINRHTPEPGYGHAMAGAEWGRKGQSHYKDGTFSRK